MEARRKAINLICKYYEFDAAKIAAAMEAERQEDNASLILILEGMIAELNELIDGLKNIRQEKKPETKKIAPKIPKPLGRRPNPNRAEQKRLDYIAKRRSQLRALGYIISRNSMVAYYDEQTKRRIRTEKSNIFGFTFKSALKK